MKNDEIIKKLEQLIPFGRPQWGLTYVVPAELHAQIIDALRKKPADNPKIYVRPKKKSGDTFGKSPE